jgi:hypothetical protein
MHAHTDTLRLTELQTFTHILLLLELHHNVTRRYPTVVVRANSSQGSWYTNTITYTTTLHTREPAYVILCM